MIRANPRRIHTMVMYLGILSSSFMCYSLYALILFYLYNAYRIVILGWYQM